MQNNIMLLGDAAKRLKEFEENSVDLVVTSPLYDNLRSYNGVDENGIPEAKDFVVNGKNGNKFKFKTKE